MQISNFLAALKGGGARPNRFEVLVEFPAAVATSEVARTTPFLAQSSQLPGSTIGTIEQFFRGRAVKLPGDRTYDDWEVTFVNNESFEIRNAFEAWSNMINSYNTNLASRPEDIFATVNVYQLDQRDNRIKSYTLKYAFPTVVAPIELAQDSNDQLEIFSVTFAFSDIINGQNT